MSGFTGSFANVVISENEAALWTDSRYHAQAEKQLDNETWTLMKMGLADVPTLKEWLVETLPKKSKVGIDPYLIPGKDFAELESYLKSKDLSLEPIEKNLVDDVWGRLGVKPKLKLKELEPVAAKLSGLRFFIYPSL